MSPTQIQIQVYGLPAPGGSKRGFVNPKNGRVIITEDSKRNKPWREAVKCAAIDAMRREGWQAPARGAIHCVFAFAFPRPKGHFRTGKHAGELRDSAPFNHTIKPDLTKVLRSTEDALTDAGVWRDDAQVVLRTESKGYTTGTPGCTITVTAIGIQRDEE